MSRAALGLAVAAASCLVACGGGYVPREPAAPLVIASGHYLKDGQTYERGFFRGQLVMLTEDVPRANAYARTARSEQLQATTADVISVLAGLGTIPAVLVDKRQLNGVTANILINTSLVFAAIGPVLHLLSADRELDAVNAYNDAKLGERRGAPAPNEVGPPNREGPQDETRAR